MNDSVTVPIIDTLNVSAADSMAVQVADTLESGVFGKQPVDSAFVESVLRLPYKCPDVVVSSNADGLAEQILALASLTVTVLLLKKIVNVFPSLIASLLRWKENCNLEASVKLTHDRNIIAATMVVPFCLVVDKFHLYNIGLLSGLSENGHVFAIIGIFLLYAGLRFCLAAACRPRRNFRANYGIAYRSCMTYFIILSFSLLIVGGVAGLINLDYDVMKIVMLWITAAVYAVAVLREFQIFASSYSVFTSFLYLCALEFVPTVILAGSAIIF